MSCRGCTGCDPVPLDVQLGIFQHRWREGIEKLKEDLQSETYLEHLRLLAEERLTDGYFTFGDEMFHWDDKTRRRNMDEELADFIVYSISG